MDFNIALDYLVKSRLDKDVPKPNVYFIGLVLCLLLGGIFFIYRGNEEAFRENRIYQRYSDDFENKINDFHKEYAQKISELDSKIKGA